MSLAGICSAALQTAAIEPSLWQSVQSRWQEATQHTVTTSIDGAINRVGNWSNSAQHKLQGVMTQPIADWLQGHPNIAWAIDHPLIALGLLLIVLLLLSGLLQAIARLTAQVWIWLLQSPLKLIRWLFYGLLRFTQRQPKLPALPATPQQERLTLILQRLETMRQEQDELLQEVRSLLAAEESSLP